MKDKDKWKAGLPYVGNKGKYAEQIIDALPAGHRLVDVFGGGGSISLHAAASGKWDEVVYNDRNKSVVDLLKNLLGKDGTKINLFDYVNINREQFFDYKDNQPDSIERTLVLLAFSFGNSMESYLYGVKNQDEKLTATNGLFFGNTGTIFDAAYDFTKDCKTIKEKYKGYHSWRRNKLNNNSVARLKGIDRLQHLGRLQQMETLSKLDRLQHLQSLQRIKQIQPSDAIDKIVFSESDFTDIEIKPDDVIYLDPPYEGTSQQYGGFDYERFLKWVEQLPNKNVFISEYTQQPNTVIYKELGKKHTFVANENNKRKIELLLKYVKEYS